MAWTSEIVSEYIEGKPTQNKNKTPYAKDRIRKRGSYKEAPPATILVSLTELEEDSDSDNLTQYMQNIEEEKETESTQPVTNSVEQECEYDEENPKSDKHLPQSEVKVNKSEACVQSKIKVSTQPSIIQTNDSPAAVPNEQKTTEVPKPLLNYLTPIFTEDFTSQRVFPSKWKDFQIDIGNILPSRDFSHVRKSFHKPYNEYGLSKYKAQNYPKYRKPIYSKSVNTPNYGFTRHRGPVFKG